jgi:hypothetical protein
VCSVFQYQICAHGRVNPRSRGHVTWASRSQPRWSRPQAWTGSVRSSSRTYTARSSSVEHTPHTSVWVTRRRPPQLEPVLAHAAGEVVLELLAGVPGDPHPVLVTRSEERRQVLVQHLVQQIATRTS